LSRINGLHTLTQPDVLSVDTLAACEPQMLRWRPLCPFHVMPRAAIPVPGRPELASRSVEAVWQGLKIVEGELGLEQFQNEPRKRPPDHERGAGYRYEDSVFRLGDRVLGLVVARYLIYLPTYLHVLAQLVPNEQLGAIEAWLNSGRDVAFYDWDANMDIDDASSSFSHSALLAQWFSGGLGPLVDRATELATAHRLPVPALPTVRAEAGVPC
jgi:hypothetical protein